MDDYTEKIEQQMKWLYNSLGERNRRRYATSKFLAQLLKQIQLCIITGVDEKYHS